VVDVAGGDRRAGVPELLADDVDRDALGGELGAVGVPQPVLVHALVDAGPSGLALEHGRDVLAGQRAAGQGAEQRAAADARGRAASVHRSTAAMAPGSRPAVRARAPLPRRIRIVLASGSTSEALSARTSPMRSPAR